MNLEIYIIITLIIVTEGWDESENKNNFKMYKMPDALNLINSSMN